MSSEDTDPDELPSGNDLTPEQTNRALMMFHFQVVGISLWWVVSQPGSLLMTDLSLKYIGLSRDTVGLMSTVICGAGLVQLVASLVMNRFRNKRLAVVMIGSLEMLALLSVLLLPKFLPGTGTPIVRLRCGLFMGVFFISGICLHLTQPTLSNWFSTIVPKDRRGRCVSTRMLVLSVALIIGGFTVAQILHYTESAFHVIATLMIIGSIIGIMSYVVLSFAPMPSVSMKAQHRMRDLWACLHHRPFRRFILFSVLLNAPFGLSAAWYAAFFLTEVGLNRQQISIYGVTYSVVRLIGFKPVGWLVDRYGTRIMAESMIVLYAVFFGAFFFFNAETFPLIVAGYAVAALGDAMFGVAIVSAMYHAIPENQTRSAFFAVERGIILTVLMVGPMIGALYFKLVGDFRFEVIGFEIEKFRSLFMFSGVLVLTALTAIRNLPDTHDVRLVPVLIQLYRTRLLTVIRRPWRLAMRRGDASDLPENAS